MANVKEFLDAYFGGYAAKEKTRQFNAEQAYNYNKLNVEADQHNQEMAQRATQLKQQEDWHKATEDRLNKQDEAASQEKFNLGGGFSQPTPTTSQPIPFQVGGAQPAPAMDLSFMGGSKPQVGPSTGAMSPEDQSSNLIQGLPLRGSPAVPMQGELPASAQSPAADPEYANQVTGPLGREAGKTYYQKTDQQIQKEKRAGLNEANQMEITPELAAVFPDFKFKPGDSIDARFLPLMKAELDFKTTQAEKAREFGQKQEDMAYQKDKDRQNAMAMKQLEAAIKANNGLTDSQISANHTGVMSNPDAFHELSPKEKTAEREQLQSEGLPPPRKAGQRIESTEFFANRAIQSSNRIMEMLSDPNKAATLMKRIGPVLGRQGNLEQAVGAAAGFPNTQEGNDARDLLQQFRSLDNYLVFQEGQSLFGGRIPIQLMEQLQSSSPSISKALPEFLGSIKSVKANSEDALVAGERYRFDGKMRPNFYKDHNITGRSITENQLPSNKIPTLLKDMNDGDLRTITIDKAGTKRTVVKREGKYYEQVRE